MSKTKKKPFTIFYSWQSDLPDQVNAQLIRGVLGEAVIELTEDEDLGAKAACDEATRDEPGSPKIVDKIFEKILKSDAFVCDLSKVHETTMPDSEVRKFCNPNVAIELGFAVRELGWDRIILVFNKGYGTLPHDLPFDTHGNRAMQYRCIAEFNGKKLTQKTVAEIANAKGQLKKQLVAGLKLIITKNPKRPRELELKSPAEIQHARDIEQLNRLFSFIHLKMLDHFIDRLGYGRVTMIGKDFFAWVHDTFYSNSFHIYDSRLRRLLKSFVEKWGDCFRYANQMDLNSNSTELFFLMPMDIPKSDAQEKQYKFTAKSRYAFHKALNDLLKYVRAEYLEIDTTKCGQEAMEIYLKSEK